MGLFVTNSLTETLMVHIEEFELLITRVITLGYCYIKR